jgi:hypothetical protein
MLIVREVFTCKPGSASKLAAMLKAANAAYPAMRTRILTDYAAAFNTVVMEVEVADMAEFDGHMHQYRTNAALRESLKGYTDLYLTGRREVFQIVA